MSIVTLKEVLQPAMQEGHAVAGLVCLGWEDMRAYVMAAEAENAPVIIQAGPGCRAHTPLPVLGKMMGYLAEQASVPVVVHLDHGNTFEECKIALDSGFTSVMYDGSKYSLSQNIEETAKVAELARSYGATSEGEIGHVGYVGDPVGAGTVPEEAAEFARQTGIDAMAIAIGNVHLQQEQDAILDLDKLHAIEALTQVPLVIHGGSGVASAQRTQLAKTSNICKFNIGTELRMAFGEALRTAVNKDPQRFDRVSILKETHEPVLQAARNVITGLIGR